MVFHVPCGPGTERHSAEFLTGQKSLIFEKAQSRSERKRKQQLVASGPRPGRSAYTALLGLNTWRREWPVYTDDKDQSVSRGGCRQRTVFSSLGMRTACPGLLVTPHRAPSPRSRSLREGVPGARRCGTTVTCTSRPTLALEARRHRVFCAPGEQLACCCRAALASEQRGNLPQVETVLSGTFLNGPDDIQGNGPLSVAFPVRFMVVRMALVAACSSAALAISCLSSFFPLPPTFSEFPPTRRCSRLQGQTQKSLSPCSVRSRRRLRRVVTARGRRQEWGVRGDGRVRG